MGINTICTLRTSNFHSSCTRWSSVVAFLSKGVADAWWSPGRRRDSQPALSAAVSSIPKPLPSDQSQSIHVSVAGCRSVTVKLVL